MLGSYLPPVKVEIFIDSAPDDHFAAGPDCRVKDSCKRGVSSAGSNPTIRDRVVSAASIRAIVAITSSPHNHLTARPHSAVTVSRRGRAGETGGDPTVG